MNSGREKNNFLSSINNIFFRCNRQEVNLSLLNRKTQLFPLKVVHATPLQLIQILLQPRVRVGIRVRKLIDIFVTIETESERHYVVLSVVRTSVVKYILRRYSLPFRSTRGLHHRTHSLAVQTFCFTEVDHVEYDSLVRGDILHREIEPNPESAAKHI